MSQRLRLGVNIDHVATIRNARGGDHPDPVRQNLSYWRISVGATFLWAIAP